MKIANQSFCTKLQLMMMHHNTKFGNKIFGSLEDIMWTNTEIYSFTVILTLKTANQSFRKTIWLMMMHHHTQFGDKRLSDSEDIVETVIF